MNELTVKCAKGSAIANLPLRRQVEAALAAKGFIVDGGGSGADFFDVFFESKTIPAETFINVRTVMSDLKVSRSKYKLNID
jgi:hypothetical protein